MLFRCISASERIADGKIEGKAVFETTNVVITRLACVVRQVESESPVESDDEEVEVVSYASTGSDGYLFEEAVEAEVVAVPALVVLAAEIPENWLRQTPFLKTMKAR